MILYGLSPRTRGGAGPLRPQARDRGSIPAHAWEPACTGLEPLSAWVYPRARGGASGPNAANESDKGLSPRTRGSLLVQKYRQAAVGSIPAHAGEPSPSN